MIATETMAQPICRLTKCQLHPKRGSTVAMIDDAFASGKINAETVLIEPTSGNTGIGLMLAASQKGYKCVFVMTDKASIERVRYLKAMGAEVVIVSSAAKASIRDTIRREFPITLVFFPLWLVAELMAVLLPKVHWNKNGPRVSVVFWGLCWSGLVSWVGAGSVLLMALP